MSVWPEYTVGRAWLIVRDVNFICHMQIGVSFIWVTAKWILACSEHGRTVWGDRWRGEVRGREEDRRGSSWLTPRAESSCWAPVSSGSRLFHVTISTFINSRFRLVFGMCVEVPFCDWSACVDIHACRRCEEESSAGATLISGVILSFSPQGHSAKRALSESTAGQHTAESLPYPTPAPHGLSDGFTRAQTRLALSCRFSYRCSLISLLLDNINANRPLFSHPST